MTTSLLKYRLPFAGAMIACVMAITGAVISHHFLSPADPHAAATTAGTRTGNHSLASHTQQPATAPSRPHVSHYTPALGQAQADADTDADTDKAAASQPLAPQGNRDTDHHSDDYNSYGAQTTQPIQNTPVAGLNGVLDSNRQLSQSERYRVEVRTPEPLHVGPLHDWHIRITDTRTTAEPQLLQFSVSGGMEAHGHGLPSQPSISGHHPQQGYTVSGMRFNMPGKWFVLVEFVTSSGPDWARFDIEFTTADSAASRSEASDSENTTAATASRVTDHGQHEQQPATAATLSWSKSELQVLASLRLPAAPAHRDEGNRVANVEAAAALGHRLFFDRGLSRDGTHACSDCHQPSAFFADALRTGHGKQPMTRNTPSIVGTAGQDWYYADGRRDSLWSQALVPLEAPGEMGSTRIRIIDYISRHYREPFESLFGPLPVLSEQAMLAMDATPMGDAIAREQWQALPRHERQLINMSFANVGKLLAAYQQRLQHAPSAVDRYIDALVSNSTAAADTLLSASAATGLKLFISGRTQCMNCHNSFRFSNGGFHNIGTGPGVDGSADFGRMMGIQMALLSEFNCRSRYNDNNSSGVGECRELDHINRHEINGMMRGAFKVPGLRGIAATAPYMHDGRYARLEEVLDHYGKPSAEMATRQHEMPSIEPFTKAERDALIAFMQALGSEIDADKHWQQAPAE